MSILVSINCTTYNQEKYIADAIEGFLVQKTDFEYEILIGEDCSTDQTRKIVEEYVRKYPDKVKLIANERNVGFKKNSQTLFNQSKGKYIALCEGDDYWINPNKLQQQVDYLEENPECTMCFHAAQIISADKVPLGTFVRPSKNSQKITAGEFALAGGGSFPTGSAVFPKSFLEDPPEWYRQATVDDFPMALILASHGYAYYIDEVMSVYRTGVEGSWTSQLLTGENVNYKKIANNESDIFILKQFNQYSNYKFRDEVDKAILFREFYISIYRRNRTELKKEKYKEVMKELGIKGKIKYLLLFLLPGFSSEMAKLYGRIVKTKYNLMQ